MKRILYLLAMVMLAVVMGVGAAGCSGIKKIRLESQLEIQSDESGCRTITASVAQETIKKLFTNSQVSFVSFIKANCPDCMTWEYEETRHGYELQFYISFQSLDEYQAKIGVLTGESRDVLVSRPDVGVKTGFTLSEDISTVQLFSWFEEALKKHPGVRKEYASGLLENGKNEMEYAGRSYEQEEDGIYVYVENLLDAEYIDIITELSFEDRMKRRIKICFPAEMKANAANVRAYLTTLLPERLSEHWENDTIWCIDLPECSLEEIGYLTEGLFQSKRGRFEETEVAAQNAMCIKHTYEETLNFTFFAPSAGKTTLRYFVKDENKAVLSSEYKGNIDVTDTTAYQGYTCLFHQEIGEGSVRFSATYQYQPEEILIKTQVVSPQDINRKTDLILKEAIPKQHQELMFLYLKQCIASKGTILQTASQDRYVLSLYQRGTQETICAGTEAVFGASSDGQVSKDHAVEQISCITTLAEPFDTHIDTAYTSIIDYRAFLVEPAKTMIRHEITLPAKEYSQDGKKKQVVETTEGICQLAFETTKKNPIRIWCFGIGIAGILFALYGLGIRMAEQLKQTGSVSRTGQQKTKKRKNASQKTNQKR